MRNDASDVTHDLATPSWIVLAATVYRWTITTFYKAAMRLIVAHACRRSRRALAALDDRLLRDIGLTRDQARSESVKGYWE